MALGAGVASASLLTGCAGSFFSPAYGEDEVGSGVQEPQVQTEPSLDPAAEGYPVAPPQQLPESAGFGIWDVPVAELASPAWVQATSEATGIPARALSAYAGAAIRVSETRPECGIGWNTLAGIGAVESKHGTYGGSQVVDSGQVEPPIIGVPLDGSEGFLAIPDTDGGALDNDTEWDRAVGPMQFIPETWAKHGQDANFDGAADPHHIDDAVQTAAAYLCERGGDLTTDDGWNTAISAYNLPAEYAREVAGYAELYAS
ncbi:lytic transglycosylase domain-containing protein [Pseudoclavibacter terrae]|uniref:lytic transglycosylase domain-containing protein n=1 Tax=Pseudoclavibacter terrae TaxID=1530195 RepID=UPI0023306BDA|nr:lytic murein transglycosylase [Pseudoclavibacter terrae]